jgi:hypothetical protein
MMALRQRAGRSVSEISAAKMDREMLPLDSMAENNSVVAVFDTHEQAAKAIDDLRAAGIDVKSLSIVGKDYYTDEQVTGYYNAGDRMKYWGGLGAFWGGIWGLLAGAALFVVPGTGPVVIAGPFVAWVVGALEGAAVVGGLSVIGAGLFSLGIPKNSILKYEVAIKVGKFVLVVHGSAEDAAKAQAVLSNATPSTLDLHDAQPAHA